MQLILALAWAQAFSSPSGTLPQTIPASLVEADGLGQVGSLVVVLATRDRSCRRPG